MKKNFFTDRSGSAVVALMIIAVIILGSMLMVQTAAVVTVGNTARALEVSRQNSVSLTRLEHATKEAAQTVFGVSATPLARSLADEIGAISGGVSLGSDTLASSQVDDSPQVPRSFPDWLGNPAELHEPSADLLAMLSPNLRRACGHGVAESSSFSARYSVSRNGVGRIHTYQIQVQCRLVSVPLSRDGLLLYDLPEEIGTGSGPAVWPTTINASQIAPRGLVARRDPANIADLETSELRPAHYREMAVLSETCQYVFSSQYLRKVGDIAGDTHFVQIGAGAVNPHLAGGEESGTVYTLDVGQFGVGTLGVRSETKNLAVICATVSGSRLILSDSGGGTEPMFLAIAGPSNPATQALSLELQGSINRPIVLICYHVALSGASGLAVNGAILMDRFCSAASTTGPIRLGHLSCWGGGSVSTDAFTIMAMPAAAENLVPRAIYVATAKNFL